jgi:hypothetical protein
VEFIEKDRDEPGGFGGGRLLVLSGFDRRERRAVRRRAGGANEPDAVNGHADVLLDDRKIRRGQRRKRLTFVVLRHHVERDRRTRGTRRSRLVGLCRSDADGQRQRQDEPHGSARDPEADEFLGRAAVACRGNLDDILAGRKRRERQIDVARSTRRWLRRDREIGHRLAGTVQQFRVIAGSFRRPPPSRGQRLARSG